MLIKRNNQFFCPLCYVSEVSSSNAGHHQSLAYIAYNLCMQYTIRNVPDLLDAMLRRSAREQGKSLNEVAIEALVRGAESARLLRSTRVCTGKMSRRTH